MFVLDVKRFRDLTAELARSGALDAGAFPRALPDKGAP